ncbi:MAG: hypothetical protein ACM3VZ_01845 [Acidobacteriota bacterium]
MSLIPTENLASQLEPAWAFLSGTQRRFEPTTLQILPRPGETEHRVVLPVKLRNGTRLVAVGVMIDQDQAEAVARFMFGQAEGPVSEADVQDACLEACNVLASSVIQGCENPIVIDIGLPHEVSAQQYAHLQTHANVRVTLMSEIDFEHRIVVTVFDVNDQSVLES